MVSLHDKCLKCKSASRRFQPGEGPSRGLLHDYEPSCGPSFEAPLFTSKPTISPVPGIVPLAVAVSEEAVLLLHPRVEAPNVDQPAPVQRTLLPSVLPAQGGVGEQVLVTTLQTIFNRSINKQCICNNLK